MTIRELLQLAADLGADFRDSPPARRVGATATADELRAALGGPLPDEPTDAATVTRELAAASHARCLRRRPVGQVAPGFAEADRLVEQPRAGIGVVPA